MNIFWFIVTPFVIALDVISIVDVIRRRRSGWSAAGWIALIVILPIVGPIIYWATRKPPPDAAEHGYTAEADRRHDRERQRF